MGNVTVDFSVTQGAIKPMNAVNNGPVSPNVRKPKMSNFELYKAANFPYARNHDASFCMFYGGEHVVDVHRIFKNFDADENDPENYFFEPTDKYLLNTIEAGTKIFYRLGSSIEHGYKYGTRVPKDFHKWARICEHIILHYNCGWANGYELGIEYWEIWNEPDCFNGHSNPCWQGTEEEFIELYCVSTKYLKEKFPNLKIGGPAFCTGPMYDSKKRFFEGVKKNNAVMDFYSYHCYARDPAEIGDVARQARSYLDEYGFEGVETSLNEWNYIKGWVDDDWDYSMAVEQGLKGASFIAGTMAQGQSAPVDMLMYYDARPCIMNGLFGDNFKTRKGYYSFIAFDRLKKLGTYVPCETDDKTLHSCAATDGKSSAIMLTYYDDSARGSVDIAFDMWKANEDEKSYYDCYKEVTAGGVDGIEGLPRKEVRIDVKNVNGPFKVSLYCTDEDKNLELVRVEEYPAGTTELYVEMTLFSTWLVEIDG